MMSTARKDSILARKVDEFGELTLTPTNSRDGAFPVLTNTATTTSSSIATIMAQNDRSFSASPKKKTGGIRLSWPSSLSSAGGPICRQYIHDRVSGNSYVPLLKRRPAEAPKARGERVSKISSREQRKVSNTELHSEQNGRGGGGRLDISFDQTENNNNSNANGHAEENKEHDDSKEDWKGCTNRPPHFLCFVPPCVRRCPGFMEQNFLCEWVGKIGCHSYFKNHHVARRRIFFVGFAFNFVALCLTIVASMAFTENYQLLTHTSFTRGEISVPEWSNTSSATINIGFRAVAVTDPSQVVAGSSVSLFHNFCRADRQGDDDEETVKQFLTDEFCGECKESSQLFVVSCLINIFIILRNMFSDITRMYPKYDLNCPNCYGSLMATLSVFLGLWTIYAYQSRCFKNVEQDLQPFYRNNFTIFQDDMDHETLLNTTNDDDVLLVKFEWASGPGLDCLIVGTGLRFVDAICNYIVPTPTITRNRKEQEQYEAEFRELVPFKSNRGGGNANTDEGEDVYEDDFVPDVGDDDGLMFGEFTRLPPSFSSDQEFPTNETDFQGYNGKGIFDEDTEEDEEEHGHGESFEIDNDQQEQLKNRDIFDESSEEEELQEKESPDYVPASFHQIRPPWDRRGLPSIREEFSHELSCGDLRLDSSRSFGSV